MDKPLPEVPPHLHPLVDVLLLIGCLLARLHLDDPVAEHLEPIDHPAAHATAVHEDGIGLQTLDGSGCLSGEGHGVLATKPHGLDRSSITASTETEDGFIISEPGNVDAHGQGCTVIGHQVALSRVTDHLAPDELV